MNHDENATIRAVIKVTLNVSDGNKQWLMKVGHIRQVCLFDH